MAFDHIVTLFERLHMNIELHQDPEKLVLAYFPQANYWVASCIENDEPICIKKDHCQKAIFTFLKSDVIKSIPASDVAAGEFGNETEICGWEFNVGTMEDGYYVIPKRILSSGHDMLIHKTVTISIDFFSGTVLNTRIVPIIDKMIAQPLIVGGERNGAIPEKDYISLLRRFPTREQLHYYAQSQVEGVLCEYYPQTEESSRILQEYIERRYKRADRVYGRLMAQRNVDSALSAIREIDCAKMRFALNRMEELLAGCEKYREKIWQREIEKILLLAFPQYVAKVPHLRMPDSIGDANHRVIDIALVSMTGCVDIVEIKRPEEGQLLSQKPNYRMNYFPSRKLSGVVMQAEKYLINLQRWGSRGEETIKKLTKVDAVFIRSPRAIIITGRSAELDSERKAADFEVVKRKYAHMLDIVTYDDLVNRLKNVIRLQHEEVKNAEAKL
jgi:hypothetical protein